MLIIDPESDAGQYISTRNRARQYDFLNMSWAIANAGFGLEINHRFVCELNLYATQYISKQPGQYRRHFNVKVGDHRPGEWYLVYEQMGKVLETLNNNWASWDELRLAAYALWGVNHVHPFADGNGRTARALCYFVICRKLGEWLRGRTAFIEVIKNDLRDQYCDILQRMHDAKSDNMMTDLDEMTAFLNGLVLQQIATADPGT